MHFKEKIEPDIEMHICSSKELAQCTTVLFRTSESLRGFVIAVCRPDQSPSVKLDV